jgi:hypothetical protein
MKVAIIGTHFTGKTELCESLFSFLWGMGKDVVLVKESARRCPLPVNRASSFEAQLWILAEQIKQEIENSEHDITISDRGVPDNFAYALRAFPQKAKPMDKFIAEYSRSYSHIFKTTPLDNPIRPDGFRDTDPKFRDEIERILKGFLDFNLIEHKVLPAEGALEFIKREMGYG